MMEHIYAINHLAVLVTALIGMGLGALWYGPLFGKLWISLMGWTDEQVARMKVQGMAKSYFVNFVATLVMTWVLACFVVKLEPATFWDGAGLGATIWLGFIATVMLGSVLWEGRQSKLYLLNIAYWLVSLGLMGGVLAVWR